MRGGAKLGLAAQKLGRDALVVVDGFADLRDDAGLGAVLGLARKLGLLDRLSAPDLGIIVRASQDRIDPALRKSFTRPVVSIKSA